MSYIIDRFEGSWAVIEYERNTFSIPRELLPPTVKEGSVININVTLDIESTKNRRSDAKKLMDELFEEA
ncbi:MAG: DUF3006 domain-containing protein [Bacillota bacterium]|jgi:hypothetical protein|nr:DUF3006 domain-containing protein [Clostridia bacterium]